MVAELEKVFLANFENYFLDILQDTNIPGNSSFNIKNASQSILLVTSSMS